LNRAIEITKTSLEDENLSDLLIALGFSLKTEFGLKLIYCTNFDTNLTNNEIWEIGVKLRNTFKEDTKLDTEFALGAIIKFKENGFNRHHFIELQSSEIRTTCGTIEVTVNPPANLTEIELAIWHKKRKRLEYESQLKKQKLMLVPAFFSANANTLLKFLELKSHTGETLYKMYELMEVHPSKRRTFHSDFNISNHDFKRFGDAVHNPEVSGELARHAYKDKTKTLNPMTFSEAQTFIEDLAKSWLKSVTCEKEIKN
jgi:hypothetical protein